MFLIGKKIHGVLIFCGHGGVVGTIVVEFTKYTSYYGLISWIRGIQHEIHENLCTLKFSICIVYHITIITMCLINYMLTAE